MSDEKEENSNKRSSGTENTETNSDDESFIWIENGDNNPEELDQSKSTDAGADRRKRLWHTDQSENDTETGVASEQSKSTDAGADRRKRLWHTNENKNGQQDQETQASERKEGSVVDQPQKTESSESETEKRSAPTESIFNELVEQSKSSGRPSTSRTPDSGTEQSGSRNEFAELFRDIDAFDRAMAGSQILVLGPTDHSITDSICSEFVTIGGVSGRDVMCITTSHSPERRLEIIQNTPEWSGGRVAIIEVGDLMTSDSFDHENVIHKRISSPKNLQKIGLVVTQTLKKWSNPDRPSTVCFHTISDIRHHVQGQTLFSFLYTLKSKLSSMGVTGHYHMNPAEHDRQDPDTFKSMFDFVLQISRDGSINIE